MPTLTRPEVHVDGYDAGVAIRWANAIGDEQERIRTVEYAARRWLREDEAEALEWIQQAPMPEELRERLIQ